MLLDTHLVIVQHERGEGRRAAAAVSSVTLGPGHSNIRINGLTELSHLEACPTQPLKFRRLYEEHPSNNTKELQGALTLTRRSVSLGPPIPPSNPPLVSSSSSNCLPLTKTRVCLLSWLSSLKSGWREEEKL